MQGESKSYKQTSYWYTHRQPAYLMYLKDVVMRIDPTHKEVKQSIETYIKEATALESTLFDIQTGYSQTDIKEIRGIEQEIKQVDNEVQELTKKLWKLKISLIRQTTQQQEAKQVAMKYFSTIYNKQVEQLNQTLQSQVGKKTLGTQTRLIKYENEEEEFSLANAVKVLHKNQNSVQKCIRELRERQKKINIQKEEINQKIVTFFEKEGRRLFQAAKKRFQFNASNLAKINSLQAQIEKVNESILKLQQIQNRKISNINLYTTALQFKDKDHLRFSRVTIPQSIDSEYSQNSVDYEPMNNPKIVFSQEKPNKTIWVILALWFIALLYATTALAF